MASRAGRRFLRENQELFSDSEGEVASYSDSESDGESENDSYIKKLLKFRLKIHFLILTSSPTQTLQKNGKSNALSVISVQLIHPNAHMYVLKVVNMSANQILN